MLMKSFLIFVICWFGVQGQHCTIVNNTKQVYQYTKCVNIGSFNDILNEFRLDWTRLVVVNEEDSIFYLDDTTLDFSAIEKLDLSGAGHLEIHDTGFMKFPGLEILNITNSNLDQTKPSWLPKATFLESFDVSNNRLTGITRQQLKKLTKLKVFNASSNEIGIVEQNAFKEMTRLEVLNLRKNKISNMDFGELLTLKSLNLFRNELVQITADFTKMPMLEKIDLARNKINVLGEKAFNGLANLKVLNLSDNALSQIAPKTFLGLGKVRVEELDLSRNKIEFIEADGFLELKLLTSLNLSDNSLTELDGTMLNGLKSLKRLILNRNELSVIKVGTFQNMPLLDTLECGENKIQYLSDNLFGAIGGKLKRLVLSSNSITEIDPNFFATLGNLEYLNLAFNELRELGDGLIIPPKLKKLYLNHNQLEYIWDKIINDQTELNVFAIQNNRMTYLPDTTNPMKKLLHFTIENNPWQCVCMMELIKMLNLGNIAYSRDMFDGTRPVCVVSPTPDECVKDINFVRDNLLVEKYEEAYIVPRISDKN